ncbi:hypothetical protein [Providencia burhodogranariea]|uniref:Uncharacterized protein n=1 Tax=Providencia burhodogranariea DSM 19968 TaxID=1141662 RepID=K8WC60_9GAMM|nr:hypothetical protein [Providencia burhodogranariea]EKT58228.1 hypothetical protein OOA_13917 [Providencia burhodogranariea DSM 19968]
MPISNIYTPFSSTYTSYNTPTTEKEAEKPFNALKNSATNIDKMLTNGIHSDKANSSLETLLAVATHQKQITVQMISQNANPEDAITLLLKDSIDQYALQLESIYAWTVGGKSVLNPMLEMMAESIFKEGVSSTKFEDLVQIIVMDMMLRGVLPDDMKKLAGYFLEDAGSGTHGPMSQVTPKDLGKFMMDIYQLALKDDKNSLAFKVANEIETNYKSEFYAYQKSFADTFWTNPDGFMDGFNGSANKDLPPITGPSKDVSPFFKLSIISVLSSKGEITTEEFTKILTSDLATIKEIAGIDGSMVDWIVAETPGVKPWQGNGADGVGAGQVWWSFPGYGIDYSYLDTMFNDFPPRDLTEDEIEEINRIGDQVKMIQQTLKYWIQLCSDEQLAMARNI